MKTKSFLLFSTSVFAISIFLIVFHSQPPQSIQTIVIQTHQHIKDFQENLRDVEENHLVQEKRYFKLLGLDGQVEQWHNTTLPVLVTYARGDDHALAVSFVRAAQQLPFTVLLYNLGLKPYSLSVVSNYCNSSKCAIIDFDLEAFPSHVSDESIHAFRPLIIQHALSRVGGVVFCESSQRWRRGVGELSALWARVRGAGVGGGGGAGAGRAGGALGVLAWPLRPAVTSLTHPRMFHYFHANIDDFLFMQMVDVTRLVIANKPATADIMRPWIQCALTLDCIMPIGAQSGGCRFDKKPQYRYSGCHEQDASALSIVLGLRSGFEEAQYTAEDAHAWRRVSQHEARLELAGLERNSSEAEDRTDHSAASAPAAH
ncbi:uncharacterized protein LOC106139140 isoform X2 [Amyelois transitella]|uniref:uncharacterized protein LOC106139140 isoform X2 n=1 Tax=Amyelois transitella TaxID=680683 RepID=UPI00298F80AB|nr:uncharacterized protein LOC106139140 isoform X2 [Amyelois transitella]